jgi:hypothetical protein
MREDELIEWLLDGDPATCGGPSDGRPMCCANSSRSSRPRPTAIPDCRTPLTAFSVIDEPTDDTLARFAEDDVTLMPVVRQHLATVARSGRPALEARARTIRSRLLTQAASDSETPAEAYVARPKGAPRGGVLVLHAFWGLTPFVRTVCDRLARAGFLAMAPDLFEGHVATTPSEAERLRRAPKRKAPSKRVRRRTLTFLNTHGGRRVRAKPASG